MRLISTTIASGLRLRRPPLPTHLNLRRKLRDASLLSNHAWHEIARASELTARRRVEIKSNRN